MGKTYSPLRYPGGKSSIYPMIAAIIDSNFSQPCSYVEPYAGGGGLALALLFSNKAKDIYLNDLDKAIWSLWYSILNDVDSFIEKIKSTEVSMDEWHKQRHIQNNTSNYSILDVGFSTFFLNRTNRSGIILKAGVIGGLSQSNEKYKLDCRFNKEALIGKILRINEQRERIHIFNNDAVDFLKEIDCRDMNDVCFFIDPPYYEKGASLYTNFYDKNDHAKIADTISSLKNRWILTYDNSEEIKKLYSKYNGYEFFLNYSLAKKRLGTEFLFCNHNVNIPNKFMGCNLIPFRS